MGGLRDEVGVAGEDDDDVVLVVVEGTAGEGEKIDALIGPGEDDEELAALLREDDALATLGEAEEELAALLIEADVGIARMDELDVLSGTIIDGNTGVAISELLLEERILVVVESDE